MSKYVKELMMDQLRTDLDGTRSLLILDLKGLDAIAEHGLRRDLRKKSIRLRVLKNSLARRVFTDMGMEGLSQYLEGPSVAGLGGRGHRRAGQGDLHPGQDPQEARDQGGRGRRRGRRPGAGRGHHQAAQPRGPDRAGAGALARPGPRGAGAGHLAGSSTLIGQLEAFVEKRAGRGRSRRRREPAAAEPAGGEGAGRAALPRELIHSEVTDIPCDMS